MNTGLHALIRMHRCRATFSSVQKVLMDVVAFQQWCLGGMGVENGFKREESKEKKRKGLPLANGDRVLQN